MTKAAKSDPDRLIEDIAAAVRRFGGSRTAANSRRLDLAIDELEAWIDRERRRRKP